MDDMIIKSAMEIYDAKIRSGKYDHYTEAMLDVLMEDCVKQAAMMHHINSRSAERGCADAIC